MSILTRTQVRQKCNDDFNSIVQGATAAKMKVEKYLQSISPIPERQDDSKSCVKDILYYEGVTLSDDPENGIEASIWGEVQQKPEWVQRLYISHMAGKTKLGIQTYRGKIRQVKKERNKMMLARTYDSAEAGSAQRPWSDTELFNSERPVNFPPPEVIFADTRFPASAAVRVLESQPLSKEQILRNYKEGTEVDVVSLDYSETPVSMKRLASGIEYSHEQDIAGELTSEMIAEYMEERGAEVVNRRVRDAIKLMADKANPDGNTPIEIDNNVESLSNAIRIAPRNFVWTTVVGSYKAIGKYLAIPRGDGYANQRVLPIGATIGNDVYGRAVLPRYVADFEPGTHSEYGMEENELLFLDASEASFLHILEGSELETQEFINRTRMNEIIWSASMGVSEKYPSQTNLAKKPFRVFTIDIS